MVEEIKKSFDGAEKIGVIGSPSSTGQLTLDVLGTAVNKRLVGNLAVFNYNQDGNDHYALGQITEIMMQNVWTQDPTMRGLIRQKGRVDPITERQDTHTAKMMISSVFGKKASGFEQSILGTIPSTGTSIKLLDENIMNSILADYQNELFYLGKAYGTNIKMPMWFKHFGSGNLGAGEAYHIGVFGKTGSGKSVLAKMIISAYAKHKKMSIFVLDPQGEFSQDFLNSSPIQETFEKKLNRKIKVFTLHKLVFDYSDTLFRDLLIISGFFEKLAVYYDDHKPRFVDAFLNTLKGKGTLNQEVKPWDFYKKEAFDRVWNQIPTDQFLNKVIGTQAPRDRVKSAHESLDSDEMYKIWLGITNLFRYKGNENIRLSELLEKTEKEGTIVIIDLSEKDIPNTEEIFWNEKVQFIAIQQFLSKITTQAEANFKKGGNLNSLVVIDEAHRLAPKEKTDNENIEKVKFLLIDAIRTTRKYGLGWMFISQTLSSLHKDIISQIKAYVFGFGLAWGIERQALLELIGGQHESLSLYQMFRDPQSTLGEKEYPFMSFGPISPLSFSGMPLFFTALKYPEEFFNINFGVKNENKGE